MGGKLSPVIIVALLVVVVVIAILIFGIVTGKGGITEPQPGTKVSDEEALKPVLTLNKESEEENVNSVKIVANASTEDENGITEIVLPDKSTVKGDYATFEATENKKYSFTVNAANGESTTVSIDVTEIAEISATNPYVPAGFSVINDKVDEGFVISDESGNQYVWVPVESGRLTRSTLLDGKFEESSSSATSLVNSVAKYYGFYIGRFEASQYNLEGESVAASMAGKVPWTNITYTDAFNYASESAEKFGYEDCFTALTNSYAWDTVLEWLDKTYENYSTSTNYGNYNGTVLPTGTTEVDTINYICDLAGNVREWTTEIYKETENSKDSKTSNTSNVKQRVIRGGSANLSRTPSSHIGYFENTTDTYWGFRLILYKQ